MGALLVARRSEEESLRARATRMLEEQAERWRELAVLAETSAQRVAVPTEPLTVRRSPPPRPAAYTALATDGSEIDPDRHSAVGNYYVVNVGHARIPYGQPQREAQLRSESKVGYLDDDLFIVDPVNPRRRVPVRDRHLDARRTVAEMEVLAELGETEAAQHGDVPVVGLVDGTLLFSVLEERPKDFLRGHFYREFVRQLEKLRDADVAVAAYTSRTRGVDLVNLFQALCQEDPNSCLPCRGVRRTVQQALPVDGAPPTQPTACALRGATDAYLFGDLLNAWERTALFRVRSGVHDPYFRDHRVYFFLFRTETEVARVEIPEWVALDRRKLDWVHSTLVDQCQKGDGYPAVLARADDRAVISQADRVALETLVRQELARRGVHSRPSAKLVRKQVRTV
jgi:hypothetical protein